MKFIFYTLLILNIISPIADALGDDLVYSAEIAASGATRPELYKRAIIWVDSTFMNDPWGNEIVEISTDGTSMIKGKIRLPMRGSLLLYSLYVLQRITYEFEITVSDNKWSYRFWNFEHQPAYPTYSLGVFTTAPECPREIPKVKDKNVKARWEECKETIAMQMEIKITGINETMATGLTLTDSPQLMEPVVDGFYADYAAYKKKGVIPIDYFISLRVGRSSKIGYLDEEKNWVRKKLSDTKYWGCRISGVDFRFHNDMALRVYILGAISIYAYGPKAIRDKNGNAVATEVYFGKSIEMFMVNNNDVDKLQLKDFGAFKKFAEDSPELVEEFKRVTKDHRISYPETGGWPTDDVLRLVNKYNETH